MGLSSIAHGFPKPIANHIIIIWVFKGIKILHLKCWSSGGYIRLRRNASRFKLVELTVVRNPPPPPNTHDPKKRESKYPSINKNPNLEYSKKNMCKTYYIFMLITTMIIFKIDTTYARKNLCSLIF